MKDELAEIFDVSDVEGISNISFDVGLVISGKPIAGGQALVVDPRIKTRMENLLQFEFRP